MKRQPTIAGLSLLAACGLAAAQVVAIMPPNSQTEYLRTVFTGFLTARNVTPTKVVYMIKLEVRQPLPEGAIAVVQFENPDPGGSPLEVVHEPKPDETAISTTSPGLACIENNRYHRVVVTLFPDRQRRDVLATHPQMVAYFVPAEFHQILNIPGCPRRAADPAVNAHIAFVMSMFDHAATPKAHRDMRAALGRAPAEGLYHWGTHICAQLRRGVADDEVRRSVAEDFGENIAYAMWRGAKESICPELKK